MLHVVHPILGIKQKDISGRETELNIRQQGIRNEEAAPHLPLEGFYVI